MKNFFVFFMFLFALHFNSNAAMLQNNYGYLKDITFELYTDALESYNMPEDIKSTEESLMYEIMHAVWKDEHWVAFTLNKDLLGTFKVGQPAVLDDDISRKMYFVATFPGSLGGQDLYVSEYLNGAWSKPKNMGLGVNTEKNESNPGLLNESILTYSSGGIIKKLDLKTFKVIDAEIPSTNTVIAPSKSVSFEIQKTTVVVEPEKTSVAITPSVDTKVSVQVPMDPLSQRQSTTNTTPEFLGSKSREEMLSRYKTAIQLGAFSAPKWEIFTQLSKYGKLVYYKNEKNMNVVWITGFVSHAAAETVLQQVKSSIGFENAYITGK